MVTSCILLFYIQFILPNLIGASLLCIVKRNNQSGFVFQVQAHNKSLDRSIRHVGFLSHLAPALNLTARVK